jgi:zinc protease
MKKLILAVFLLINAAWADSTLPQSPAIKHYTLDNGFSVFLLPHNKNGVELRLIVHAGSLQENQNQLGLAHFVEHMAFKGTKNFPDKSSFKKLEAEGISLGSHINAVTSFNSTVYKLSLPASQQKSLELGLHVLSDWAYHISFNPQDFDAERDVIIEEWRLRQGVAYRLNSKLDDLRYGGSLYAKRNPIGSLDVVKNAPVSEAVAFYQRWYQPQRMSLVVVGKFDEKNMMKSIKGLFGAQPAGTTPVDDISLRRYQPQSAPHGEALFDAEQGQRLIQIMLQRSVDGTLNSPVAFSEDIVDRLWLKILNQRLNLLVENDVLPTSQMKEESVLLDANRQQYLMFAMLKQSNYAEVSEKLFTELQRMAIVPVTEQELNEAKKQILAKLRQQADNEANYGNDYLANWLTTAIEYQMPLYNKKQQAALTKSVLDKITPQSLKQNVADRLQRSEMRFAILGPEADRRTVTVNEMIKLWQKVRGSNPGEFNYRKKALNFSPTPPSGGKIVQTQAIKAIDAEEWRLSNGIRVIVQPDKRLTDDVQINLRIAGGQSLDDDDQMGKLSWAQRMADASHASYNAAFKRQQIQVSPYAEMLYHGYRGSAPNDKLESLFKLLYAKLTAPQFDAQKLATAQQNALLALNNQPVERRFLDFIHQKSFHNAQRLSVDPKGKWRQFKVDDLQQEYQKAYAVSGDMTLVIAGNFDKAKVKTLIETWLAGIPATKNALKWQDHRVTPINESFALNFPYGTSDKAMVSMIYSADADWSESDRLALALLDTIVNTRLRTFIREQNSGVYTIIFSGQLVRDPKSYYFSRLNFTTSPQRVEEIKGLVNQTMVNIKRHGVNSQELAQAKRAWRVEYNQQITSAQYWAAATAQTAAGDNNFDALANEAKTLDSITLDQVNTLANRFIGSHQKEFTLMPKTK